MQMKAKKQIDRFLRDYVWNIMSRQQNNYVIKPLRYELQSHLVQLEDALLGYKQVFYEQR